MYIDSISLENIRTFAAEKTIHFNHPDREYGDDKPLKKAPKLKNVNLLFGENSTGKSTVLEAIALSSLGPAIIESRIDPKPLVRFKPSKRKSSKAEKSELGTIKTSFTLHGSEKLSHVSESDLTVPPSSPDFSSKLLISKKGKLENIKHRNNKNINWGEVYVDENASFFIVAYGTSRRGELDNDNSRNLRNSKYFWRTDRINSIIQDKYALLDFWDWFVNRRRRGRRSNLIVNLINSALGNSQLKFEGKSNEDDCLFIRGGMEIPFRSLSDGFKAFLSWITDLLYHLEYVSRRTKISMDKIPGVVLVDEIDLHLHPRWQMEVISQISKTFPRLQFIFTSHSPLIAGSVEWMNITRLILDRQHRTGVDPFEESVHGLDADQILVSELFGLTSTRSVTKVNRLSELTKRARAGDKQAAKELISELAKGVEDNQ